MNSKVSILLALYLLTVLFWLTFAPIKLSYIHYFNASTEVIMTSIERNYRNYSCDVTWVTFVVPFRDREQHLPLFLEAIENHQKHQMKSNFNILIIEQEDKGRFNRAKLMNIGAKFAFSQMNQKCAKSKSEDHLCLIFHDIDMLPLNSNLKYRCLSGPVGLASAAQQFEYGLPYRWYFGGVVAIYWRDFALINGYSNNYWGWGGEDDDFLTRIRVKKLRWGHIKAELGRFRSLEHDHDSEDDNPVAYTQNQLTPKVMHQDGINSVTYKLKGIQEFQSHTRITVDLIPEPKYFLSSEQSIN